MGLKREKKTTTIKSEKIIVKRRFARVDNFFSEKLIKREKHYSLKIAVLP